MSALDASPSHHVSQMDPKRSARAAPLSASDPTPIVALSIVLITPASTAKRTTLPGVSNASRPPAKRPMSSAPTAASSMLPVAMLLQAGSDPRVVMLTSSAPTRDARRIKS